MQLTTCPSCQSSQMHTFIQTEAQMHPSKEVFNFDQCTSCQLVFLNPRVATEDLMNYYTDYYLPYRGPKAWGKYEALVASSQKKIDRERVRIIKKNYAVLPTSLILDIGCGQPTFLQKCIDTFGCRGMGIDFSDEGWQAKNGDFSNLDLRVSEIKDIPLSIQPDVITMWHYLEHDYTPLDNLKTLRQLAKETTTLVIEVPNLDSESRREYGKYWAGWHTPRHTSLFTPESMRILLENAGWETINTSSYGTLDPYILYWMSNMEQKNIQWNKNMETEFVDFVKGMIAFLPKKWQQKKRSLGIMTAIARPKIGGRSH